MEEKVYAEKRAASPIGIAAVRSFQSCMESGLLAALCLERVHGQFAEAVNDGFAKNLAEFLSVCKKFLVEDFRFLSIREGIVLCEFPYEFKSLSLQIQIGDFRCHGGSSRLEEEYKEDADFLLGE